MIDALPHSDEAERAVLGAVLVNDAHLAKARDEGLTPAAFYCKRHMRIFAACEAVAERGSAVDPVTLCAELGEQLEACGGAAYIASLTDGLPRSANAGHYARIVLEKARKREIVLGTAQLQAAASNGSTLEQIEDDLRRLAESGPRSTTWHRSTLQGVSEPTGGEVQYLIEGLVPKGELVLLASAWKSGKTLLVYQLVLDAVAGRPVWRHYRVHLPLRVAVFQLEMPGTEDERRFRRLAIGSGIDPESVTKCAADGRLVVFNRPPLALTTRHGVAEFHRAVEEVTPDLVVVDSLLAAFAGLDLNDNSVVRRALADAFLPLTSAGMSVLAIHHRRKGEARVRDDERGAVLGAQAFGAAPGRVYSLERLDSKAEEAAPEHPRSFQVRLGLTGSWTPGAERSVVLQVEDVGEDGTSVRVLEEAEQLRRGGVTPVQRAAIRLADLVRVGMRVEREAALKELEEEAGVAAATAKRALKYARERGWVDVVPGLDRRDNRKDLVPGNTAEEL